MYLVSNYHNPAVITTVKRRNKLREQKDVSCPTMLCDYNQNMNAVDKLDQLKSTYELDRKSHKWWHRIFFHFIDVCVVNSFILYTKLELPQKKLKNFRRDIVSGLLSETFTTTAPRKKRGTSESPIPVEIRKHKPHVANEIRTGNVGHQPMRTTRRRCGFCSNKLKQTRTEWMCKTCKVPLCVSKTRNCFESFHM